MSDYSLRECYEHDPYGDWPTEATERNLRCTCRNHGDPENESCPLHGDDDE